MANQTGKNLLVAYKVEATLNTVPAAVTGAEQMRLSSSPGLTLSMPTILPTEIRSDMLTPMARLGSRSVAGSYSGDLSVNSWDTLLEAAMRSTWTTLSTFTTADVTNVTITAAGVNGDGDWVSEGVRVGDVFRISGLAATADNQANLRVKSVSSGVIEPVETLTAEATALATFTMTVLRKLTNATTPTRRSFYVEQYYQDIDQSLVFGGCRVSGFTLRGQPDGMASVEIRMAGVSQDEKATGDSPLYTSPTEYTTDALVFTDAKIALDGSDIATATSFEINAELGGATLPVIGSTVSPDVFDNEMVVNGSLSLLRQDLTRLTALDAETEYELHILLEEPTGTPKKAFGLFVGRVKLTGVDAALGQDGAMIETIPFAVGLKASATGYEQTMLKISSELA
jgi:hypothetical protein